MEEIRTETGAAEVLPGNKKEANINRREAWAFLVCGVAIAFLYSVCFSGMEILPQLSFTLFCPVAFAALALLLKSLGYLRNERAMLWAAPIVIVSAFNGIFNINPFTYFNVVFMHLLFAVFIISAVQERPANIFSLTGALMIPRVVIGNWLLCTDIYRALKPRKEAGNDSGTVKKVILGVIISAPILFVIITLLVSADMVFGKYLEDFLEAVFDRSFIDISFALSFLAAWVYAMGYVYQGRKIAQGNKQVTLPALRADVVICATVLLLVNLVFLLFTVIQISYLFSGGLMTLPEGMIYSEYAREGFFQLLCVTIINFSVIIFFMNVLTGVKDSALLRCLLLALCGFTLVLIASSFYRMFLYTGAYGHTPLRLCVITFLVMEVFLIGITVLKLFADKTPLVEWFAVTGLVFYLVVNITGSGYLATLLNVDLFVSGRLDSIDVRSVDEDGLQLIKPFFESGEYICVDYRIIKKESADNYPQALSFADIDGNIRAWGNSWQNWSLIKSKKME